MTASRTEANEVRFLTERCVPSQDGRLGLPVGHVFNLDAQFVIPHHGTVFAGGYRYPRSGFGAQKRLGDCWKVFRLVWKLYWFDSLELPAHASLAIEGDSHLKIYPV